MDETFEFVNKVFKEHRQAIRSLGKGKTITVRCPICGGPMRVKRNGSSGHLSISCNACMKYIVQ